MKTLIAVLAGVIALTGAVYAANGYGPQGKGAYGMRGNANAMPTFEQFDLDANGEISLDEMAEAQQQRMAERQAQGFKMRRANMQVRFEALDLNGDGLLDKEEFEQHQANQRRRPFGA